MLYYFVYRREFDEERGFDRYECVIVTSGIAPQQNVAELAAVVLERSYPGVFLSVISSGIQNV